MERLYSHEEAEALLPTLTTILSNLADRVARLDQLREQLDKIPAASRSNGRAVEAASLDADVAALVATIRDLVAQIEALGVELKDPRTGLVDFRSPRDGRVVYLCWRLGESRIDYWHELDAGFAGRRPID